jgi:hypothetical protein
MNGRSEIKGPYNRFSLKIRCRSSPSKFSTVGIYKLLDENDFQNLVEIEVKNLINIAC